MEKNETLSVLLFVFWYNFPQPFGVYQSHSSILLFPPYWIHGATNGCELAQVTTKKWEEGGQHTSRRNEKEAQGLCYVLRAVPPFFFQHGHSLGDNRKSNTNTSNINTLVYSCNSFGCISENINNVIMAPTLFMRRIKTSSCLLSLPD